MGLRKGALCAALALLGATAGDVAAQQPQGFRVCNQTGGNIEVAKALNTGATDGRNRIIISEGWYQIANGTCGLLWSGPLKYKYYLVYAQNKSIRREWAGNIPICVSRQPFTIRSDTCGPEQYRRMFIQVYTGEEQFSWTYVFKP